MVVSWHESPLAGSGLSEALRIQCTSNGFGHDRAVISVWF
jgi:hypothetical protein